MIEDDDLSTSFEWGVLLPRAFLSSKILFDGTSGLGEDELEALTEDFDEKDSLLVLGGVGGTKLGGLSSSPAILPSLIILRRL